MNFKTSLFRFIVGLDQALNPLIYGGSENVTISSQSAYNELILHKSRRKRKFIDWIFRKLFGQKHHCYKALLSEIREFPNDEVVIRTILLEYGIK